MDEYNSVIAPNLCPNLDATPFNDQQFSLDLIKVKLDTISLPRLKKENQWVKGLVNKLLLLTILVNL